MKVPLKRYIAEAAIISSISANQVKLIIARKADTSRQNIDLWVKHDKPIFIEHDEEGIKRIYQEPNVITYYQRRSTKE